jgi:hypothetical protein
MYPPCAKPCCGSGSGGGGGGDAVSPEFSMLLLLDREFEYCLEFRLDREFPRFGWVAPGGS